MSKRKPMPPVRCSKCGAFLVDVTVPNAPPLEQGCPTCEPLELVDTVSQIFARRVEKQQ